jgi:hypothetical protein
MAENPDIEDEVSARFQRVGWHDSKLIGLAIFRAKSVGYQVVLQLDLLSSSSSGGRDVWAPTELGFLETRIFQSDLDLAGLKDCGGAIGSGMSRVESEFMARIASEITGSADLSRVTNPLAGLRHFRIHLISPGGELNVIARDFELLPSAKK